MPSLNSIMNAFNWKLSVKSCHFTLLTLFFPFWYCAVALSQFVLLKALYNKGDLTWLDYNDLYCLFTCCVASRHVHITMPAFVIRETTNNKSYSTLLKTRVGGHGGSVSSAGHGGSGDSGGPGGSGDSGCHSGSGDLGSHGGTASEAAAPAPPCLLRLEPYYPPKKNSLGKVGLDQSGAVEEPTLEGALEARTLEGALEAWTLEGAVEDRALESAVEELALGAHAQQ